MIPATTAVPYAGQTYLHWTFARNDGSALERGRYAAGVTLVRCRVLPDGTTEHLPPGVPMPPSTERLAAIEIPDINAPVGTDFGFMVWDETAAQLARAWQVASLQFAAYCAQKAGVL